MLSREISPAGRPMAGNVDAGRLWRRKSGTFTAQGSHRAHHAWRSDRLVQGDPPRGDRGCARPQAAARRSTSNTTRRPSAPAASMKIEQQQRRRPVRLRGIDAAGSLRPAAAVQESGRQRHRRRRLFQQRRRCPPALGKDRSQGRTGCGDRRCTEPGRAEDDCQSPGQCRSELGQGGSHATTITRSSWCWQCSVCW